MARKPSARPEPIRVVSTNRGERFRVVLDVSAPGEPRKQITKTFESIEEAREFVTETRRQVEAGTYGRVAAAALRRKAGSALTLTDVTAAWLQSLTEAEEVRPITVRGYESALRPVLARMGTRRVQTITDKDVAACLRWVRDEGALRGGPLSHRAVGYARLALRTALAYAVTEGVLEANPARDVKGPKRRRGEVRADVAAWTPEQLRRFVAAGDDSTAGLAWRLVASGLRRSEVCGLLWTSVDVQAGTVTVEASRVAGRGGQTETDDPKSHRSRRTVPVEMIWPGTAALLREAYLAADDKTGAVVVDVAGEPLHPDALTSRFRALAERAGLPAVRMHSVRHALALVMHRAGVAPVDAAAVLGHSVEVHLSVYLPRSDEGARSAADTLGRMLAAEA